MCACPTGPSLGTVPTSHLLPQPQRPVFMQLLFGFSCVNQRTFLEF